MYTILSPTTKTVYRTKLLLLAAIMLYGCGQARQLGVETEPQELLNEKLANPSRVLSTTESISLIDHCAQLGEQNAEHANNKDVVMTLGNTGTGKSTFLNALLGCKMKLVKPGEVGVKGSKKKVVVVDPESTQPEIVSIGHKKKSQTFLPQIAAESNNPEGAFCDCPGFSDSRGAEINISNAINIKRILQKARGVKAVFLTSYNGLFDDRGGSVLAMENMCRQMFGSADNLRRHQNAVLLGITKAPRYEDEEPITCDSIREFLTEEDSTPTLQILANRLFLFDPLDRGHDNPDFWSLARCRNEIAQLQGIPNQQATTLFQTVLADRDQTQLKLIMRNRAAALAEALEQDDYQAAGNHWQSLARLKVIGSDEVEQMLKELVTVPLTSFIQRRVSSYKEEALKHNFDEATRQLDLLRTITRHFPHELLEYKIEDLLSILNGCREKKRIEEEGVRNRIAKAEQAAARKAREEQERKLEREADKVIKLTEYDPSGDSGCCVIS